MMEALLKAYSDMTPKQRFQALFRDSLTNVYNRRAFELTESNYIAIVDVDSLKWVNDNLGHNSGNKLLIAVSKALESTGYYVYRLSGDEFVIRSNELDYLLAAVMDIQTKLGFISIGVGTNLERADQMLRDDKSDRQEQGLRTTRGICPPWMDFDTTNLQKILEELGV